MTFKSLIKKLWVGLYGVPAVARKQATFTNVQGMWVPTQPWPQVFYVSRELMATDTLVLRPLTISSLLRGIGRNLISINYWRLMVVLYWLGFLEVQEHERLHWGGFNLHPIRTRRERSWGWNTCCRCDGTGYDPSFKDSMVRWTTKLRLIAYAPEHAPAGCPMWYECSHCLGLGIVPPKLK